MRLPTWASGLIAFTLLTACGQTSPGNMPSAPRPLQTSPSRLRPTPPPSAQPVDPYVVDLVARGIARLDAMKNVQGQVIFDEVKDGKTDHGRAQIYFRNKPFAGRVEMLESDRWLASGGIMLWKGGTDLRIRPFRMPITLTFSYDNSQVVSLRGYRLDQTDLFSMAKVLRAPGAQITPIGPKRIRNEDLFLVQVRSSASVAGIDHEIIGLHQRHLIPTYREMYDAKGQMVHRGQGVKLVFDQTLSSDLFDL